MVFKEWLAYLRDNPHGYWFKRKLFGWGWVPVKWQGWLIIVLFILYAILIAFQIEQDSDAPRFIIQLFLSIIILIFICYLKGEKPRWQWGFPKKYKK